MIREIYKPHIYQKFGEKHVLDNPYSGLLLEMALGKTVITLSAIQKLMNRDFEISKVLVIAPKRVATIVWPDEQQKWEHLKYLRISVISGTPKERMQALKKDADVYTIGRENVAWLVRQYMTKFPFDMVVVDESSSFKNAKSIRFKALRMVRPKFKRLVILTGTPTPNGLVDLWPQMYLVDMGERLGKHLTDYRKNYFSPAKRNGQTIFSYAINPGSAEQEIYDKIADVCISMKTRDYLNLPENRISNVKIKLTEEEQQRYNDFERDQVLKLVVDELIGTEISALSATALSNKLLQYANGAVYDDKKKWHEVHNQKIDALEELIEAAQGRPMLVAYAYQHDVDRILHKFKFARKLEKTQDIRDWNDGKIQVAVTHPASTGHGLNMQYGGSIITWFGNTWSLEYYDQLNARINRPGQVAGFVTINRLITMKTLDVDVIRSIAVKAKGQNALMEAIKARIKKYA